MLMRMDAGEMFPLGVPWRVHLKRLVKDERHLDKAVAIKNGKVVLCRRGFKSRLPGIHASQLPFSLREMRWEFDWIAVHLHLGRVCSKTWLGDTIKC